MWVTEPSNIEYRTSSKIEPFATSKYSIDRAIEYLTSNSNIHRMVRCALYSYTFNRYNVNRDIRVTRLFNIRELNHTAMKTQSVIRAHPPSKHQLINSLYDHFEKISSDMKYCPISFDQWKCMFQMSRRSTWRREERDRPTTRTWNITNRVTLPVPSLTEPPPGLNVPSLNSASTTPSPISQVRTSLLDLLISNSLLVLIISVWNYFLGDF